MVHPATFILSPDGSFCDEHFSLRSSETVADSMLAKTASVWVYGGSEQKEKELK